MRFYEANVSKRNPLESIYIGTYHGLGKKKKSLDSKSVEILNQKAMISFAQRDYGCSNRELQASIRFFLSKCRDHSSHQQCPLRVNGIALCPYISTSFLTTAIIHQLYLGF